MNILQSTLFIDLSGWIGALLILIAYIFISTGKVEKNNKYYHLLNLIGSLLFVYNTLHKEAYPSAFVNVIWFFVAVLGVCSKRN